ncbi:MAG: hypothetical protein A2W22_00310 [Candidatus Levybacteria bacterium RBG_16_35_11]|nr:MAG: hypothetical protein A2W22_00310 [Candidatus Levybacteria bacterium RBG_16_35_11]
MYNLPMGFIRKNKLQILLFLLVAALYFLVRLPNLLVMPIFTDEAIYTRWAQIALNDSSWRFISLTDGKQPLFVWFAMVFMKVINDPLVAARLVSVISGLFTMFGLWFLSFELFKDKRIAHLTSIIYVFFPFAQVYDRMALMDSMVGTFSIWAFYFSILLVRRTSLSIAYTLGFTLGAGALTKSSNFFSMYCLPFTLLLFNFSKNQLLRRFLKWGILAIFAVVIAQVIYSILRLSPLFSTIAAKNGTFIYPFSEWINHPFTFLIGNLSALWDWLFGYLAISYLILILISVIFIFKEFKEKLLLIVYFAIPFFALAVFGKLIYARFIFFMSLYLLPLAGWGLVFLIDQLRSKLKINKLGYILVAVFIAYPAFISFTLLTNPINAMIPNTDKSQYLNSWAAGWGVKESIQFIEKEARKGKVYVATEGTFGLMPESLELYLVKNKNVTIKGYWPIDEFPKEVIDSSKKMQTYFVFYQPEHKVIPHEWPLKLIFQKREGNSNSYFRFYQVIP